MVSALSTGGRLLLPLPFPTFLSVLPKGLFSGKYIANIFFLLYPRAKEKDPTQFREDVIIRYCFVLNKKGNLSTVSLKKLNKKSFHPSQDRYICSLDLKDSYISYS